MVQPGTPDPPCVVCHQPAHSMGAILRQRLVDEFGGDLCWDCGAKLFPTKVRLALELEAEAHRRQTEFD